MKYHVTNTDNPIDFPQVKYFHVVHLCRILENGKPDLHKPRYDEEFNHEDEAREFIKDFNQSHTDLIAVYVGKVNDETGELI
jgi:hypothetical protein